MSLSGILPFYVLFLKLDRKSKGRTKHAFRNTTRQRPAVRKIYQRNLENSDDSDTLDIYHMFLLSRYAFGVRICARANTEVTGMYNAISGLGGSGQLDSTVAANATVALLAATAASALTLVPPIFDVRIRLDERPIFRLIEDAGRCSVPGHACL